MLFKEKDGKRISAKLEKALEMLNDAYSIARGADKSGESDLSIHIDSIYNDLTDTMSILYRSVDWK